MAISLRPAYAVVYVCRNLLSICIWKSSGRTVAAGILYAVGTAQRPSVSAPQRLSDSAAHGPVQRLGSTHIVVVVDLYHGRVDAGAQTLDLGQSEHAILGRFAVLNACRTDEKQMSEQVHK